MTTQYAPTPETLTRPTPHGEWRIIRVRCVYCNGQGRVNGQPCRWCDGNGKWDGGEWVNRYDTKGTE